MYHGQRVANDAMLSAVEKHTTSFKSGISIKNFNFAILFFKKP